MLQKILAGVFVVAMVAAIITGITKLVLASGEEHALQRGSENSRQPATVREQVARGGQGRGQNRDQVAVLSDEGETSEPTAQRLGQGQGQGQGGGEGRNVQPQTEHTEWQVIEGTVVEVDELVIETEDGQRVQVGLGPSHYRESQGFVLDVGARVRVSGYLEDGEFKAGWIENLTMDTSVVLRDESGHPMWAGQGRRSG